jgi:hypothetical protein
MQADGVAVHFGQSEKPKPVLFGLGAVFKGGCGSACEQGGEAERAQPFEIDVDHGSV